MTAMAQSASRQQRYRYNLTEIGRMTIPKIKKREELKKSLYLRLKMFSL